VKGDSGVEPLAHATGTSVRTLQRRLREAGVSYNDLQNDVRKTLALNLLGNETLALSEIAFSLGYSEVSAFNHAFRRWVGHSPGDYRRERAARGKSAAARSRSLPPGVDLNDFARNASHCGMPTGWHFLPGRRRHIFAVVMGPRRQVRVVGPDPATNIGVLPRLACYPLVP
jgi:AraC-like DNA-binding protein